MIIKITIIGCGNKRNNYGEELAMTISHKKLQTFITAYEGVITLREAWKIM